MTIYSPAWPHSSIQEVFPNIFFVMGTNITYYEGSELQHSRNMVIIKQDNELSLINTVRLNEEGLTALDELGEVKNVIRIGAFHGRDDAFYLDRYKAKFWAIKGMQCEKKINVELEEDGQMPFLESSFLLFETSTFPGGVFYLKQEGGILITCDSIKNWIAPDPFFSEETAKHYQQQGFFGPASISSVWKQATQVRVSDFDKLMALPFRHLISAHGDPLFDQAYEQVRNTMNASFTYSNSN